MKTLAFKYLKLFLLAVAMVNLTVPQTNATINQTVNGGGGSDANAIMDAMTRLLARQHAAGSNIVPT